MLKGRVDRLAREPEDLEMLVEAITLYHMVIEGMLALTGQHFILQYNEELGTLPGLRARASTTWRATSTATSRSARASCARWRRRPPLRGGDPRARWRGRPDRGRVLGPSGTRTARRGLRRLVAETRAFAMKALERRLKVIGLAPAAA